MISLSDLIAKSIDNLSPEALAKYNKLINVSAVHLSKLLENLLVWARSQTGRIEYKPKKIDLRIIAATNIDLMRYSASRKNIELINELNRPIYAFADADTISTVVRNLITNAIKFTNSKGVVKVSAKEVDDKIEVTISDNGVGINEENLEKLFRIDVHHSTKGTDSEKGTGLGLILCKEFVEKNHGEIRVESNPGDGSKFIFSVPQVLENNEQLNNV